MVLTQGWSIPSNITLCCLVLLSDREVNPWPRCDFPHVYYWILIFQEGCAHMGFRWWMITRLYTRNRRYFPQPFRSSVLRLGRGGWKYQVLDTYWCGSQEKSHFWVTRPIKEDWGLDVRRWVFGAFTNFLIRLGPIRRGIGGRRKIPRATVSIFDRPRSLPSSIYCCSQSPKKNNYERNYIIQKWRSTRPWKNYKIF